MIVSTLRKNITLALIGLAVSLIVALPCAAYADENEPAAERSIATSASFLEQCETLATNVKSTNLIDLATSFEGSPYVYGGTTPRGFDCSGFTSYCFRKAMGIELPRTAAGQAGLGTSVSIDNLKAGDLLFWGSGSGVYHVGIYLEGNTYIHAAGSGKGVRISTMDYYHPSFAKRII